MFTSFAEIGETKGKHPAKTRMVSLKSDTSELVKSAMIVTITPIYVNARLCLHRTGDARWCLRCNLSE
jgi:hypothetical protein